jgi:hypothetical protein
MTDNPTQTYKYDSVSRDDLETHVLTLYPGLYDDEIRIRLTKTLLSVPEDELVEYEALSYSWGHPEMTHAVMVEPREGWPGGVLPITSNMDAALRSLRLQHRPRVLWVDAICINQSNLLERNHQVQWMDQVYKKARRVVVYIGEASDSDAEAVDIFTSIGKSVEVDGSRINPLLQVIHPPHLPEAVTNHSDKLRTLRGSVHAVTALLRLSQNRAFIKLSEQHGPSEYIEHDGTYATRLQMTLPAVHAVLRLTRRPWFSRVWVIQEVRSMREPNESILQYGTRSVSWDHFRKGILAFRHLPQRHDDSHAAALTLQMYLLNVALMLCHREIKISIKEFLILQEFQCADPRDRLYGVLSLLRDDLGYPLTVDYLRPIEAVFEEFQRQELQARGIWLLPYCHMDPKAAWSAPSWVPNQHSFPSHLQEIRDVPAGRFATDFELVDDRCLKVYGRHVATVRNVVKCPPLVDLWSPTEGIASVLSWMNCVASGLCSGSHLDEENRARRLTDAIMGLCDIRGDYLETHIPKLEGIMFPRAHMKAFVSEVFSALSSSGREPTSAAIAALSPDTVKFLFALYLNLERAFKYSSNPIVFATDADESGYGPASARPGDRVFTILGSGRDLLLRPVPGKDTHVIVGPASLGSNTRSEKLLGPLPSHIFEAADSTANRQTFRDNRTGERVHDPRLDRLGLREMAEGLDGTHIRAGDLKVSVEALRRHGLELEPVLLE